MNCVSKSLRLVRGGADSTAFCSLCPALPVQTPGPLPDSLLGLVTWGGIRYARAPDFLLGFFLRAQIIAPKFQAVMGSGVNYPCGEALQVMSSRTEDPFC